MTCGQYLVVPTSVWNLLSHMYKVVLMGRNGSKSNFTCFSLPSSVRMVPQ